MRRRLLFLWLAGLVPAFGAGLEFSPYSPTAVQIDDYLASKKSPIGGIGAALYGLGQQYNIDPRLVVAIAGAETTFGLHQCTDNNAWNWFHRRTCPASSFTSYQEGAEHVTRFLRLSYLNRGYDTIELIRYKYCASGCDNWIPLVTSFHDAMPTNGQPPSLPPPAPISQAQTQSPPSAPDDNRILGLPRFLVFFLAALLVGAWAMTGLRKCMRAAFIVACCLICTCLSAQENHLTDVERKQGWHLLFDGTTTRGWLEITGKAFPTQSWTIEDGCLKAVVRTDGLQDIRTADEFRSFELAFDWKLPADGNSGVKYLIQRAEEWVNQEGRQARALGLEYQLAGDRSADAASAPARVTGSLYSVLAPANRVAFAMGDFNHSRILVRGDHAEHWLNGSKVLEFDITKPVVSRHLLDMLPKDQPDITTPLRRESAISLQNGSSPAWFRNLKSGR